MKPVLLNYGQHKRHRGDLYLPDAPRAVIVHAHGGGFQSGTRKTEFPRKLAHALAPFGYALFAIDYRLRTPMADLPTGMQKAIAVNQRRTARAGLPVAQRLCGPEFTAALLDMDLAVRFAARGLGGLPPLPVCAMGNSAGGIMALSLAYPPANLGHSFVRPAAVAALSATLVQPWCLAAGGPPAWMLHGPWDRVVPTKAAQMTKMRAERVGAPLSLTISGLGGHNTQMDALLGGDTADHLEDLVATFDAALKHAG